MQTTQLQYRLDYHGDGVPEYLSDSLVELVLARHYPPADVMALLAELRQGRRVPVAAGWLRGTGAATETHVATPSRLQR